MTKGFALIRKVLNSVSVFRKAPTDGEGVLQAINPKSEVAAARIRETSEARRYACVCSIIVDRSGRGSGFLIADDLVMTNHHVVFDRSNNKFFEPRRIKVRFNFFSDGQYENDEHDWISLPEEEKEAFVAYSPPAPIEVEGISENESDYLDPVKRVPLLDYAILRLTSPVGKETGRTALDLEVRPLGWIALSQAARFGEQLTVFQFPERVGATGAFSQQSLQTSSSTFARPIANGLRAHYDASTSNGSSGSPVFDDVSLVGLHNAGETRANTADNRFIPIEQILLDLAKRSPRLYAQLIKTKPPPIAARMGQATAKLSDRVKRAIDERVRAAETLLDREFQHDLIQAKLRTPNLVVHVNHVACREKFDEVELFVDRIKVGAAQAETTLAAPKFIERYLCGSNAAENATAPWGAAGMTWPPPKTSTDLVRTGFRNAFTSNRFASRTLVILAASNIANRSQEEEHSYMKILGEECARYVETKKIDSASAWQALQILVIYKAPNTITDLSPIVPLWTEPPPPYCGASFELPKVKRDDIEASLFNINEAWKKSNIQIAWPIELAPEADFYMTEVVAKLKAQITKAAIALTLDGGESTP